MNKTLLLIKPNATKKNVIGKILSIIEENNFKIKSLKSFYFSRLQAAEFYAVHSQKEFFEPLLDFMCSGLTVAVVLTKQNAVQELRKVVGATNPENAEKGTIRNLFGDSLRHNAVHASDSNENAQYEISVLF